MFHHLVNDDKLKFDKSFSGSTRKLFASQAKPSTFIKKNSPLRKTITQNMDKIKKIEFLGPKENGGDDGNVENEIINEDIKDDMQVNSKDNTPKASISEIKKEIILNQDDEEEKAVLTSQESIHVEINFGDIHIL